MPVPEQQEQLQSAEQPAYLSLQFRLTVGAPDDPLEHEADAMADMIMRMPEQPGMSFGHSVQLQRKCAACEEEEEEIQRRPLSSFIQKKGSESSTPVSDGVADRISSTRGSGSSMDTPTQSFMENRFSADFSGVRIHTGDYAVSLSRDLGAQAFTLGNDIYFNSGKYSPSTDSGKHLLAHELTHTIQQQASVVGTKRIQRVPDTKDEGQTNAGIVYTDAIKQNLAAWETRDRFYNIFVDTPYGKGVGIFPGSTPNAYANHVYAIQEALKGLWKDKYLGSVNGIVDDRLLTDLETIAKNYEDKKKTPQSAYGIDTTILERFLRIKRNETHNAVGLGSGLGNYAAFKLINTNYLFGVALNDRGDHVTYLQTKLFDMNYLKRDDVTGSYDQKTYDAIRTFQSDTGLKVDGIVGPSTLQMLDNFLLGRTTAFILPGERFSAWGKLSEVITIYTDGDGDQKKELRLEFTKKSKSVVMYVTHVDTGEKRGPLAFDFPGLDLSGSMWISEYIRSNGLRPTVIKLTPDKKEEPAEGSVPPEYLITIKPPETDKPGLYQFNDQTAQFNADKFDPMYGFAAGEQVNVTNPTYIVTVGPYGDDVKLFFKSVKASASIAPDAATGRIYDADLYLIGQAPNGIIYGGKPMRVKLKGQDLKIVTVRHNATVMSFDLDGDGVEDIVLNYLITEAQDTQRPDFNRFIDLYFTGAALAGEERYRFEKIAGQYVFREAKSEDLFKQLVAGIGNEKLDQQQLPETRQQDIGILNNLLGQLYIKALEADLIKGDTYLAWKKLDISLQYLNMFVKGKATLTDDDKDKISKTATFADEYLVLIKRDTAGKEKTGSYGIAVAPGAASSTNYKENPYTGESTSTTTAGITSNTTNVTMDIGAEIRLHQWDKMNKSYDTLSNGFNLWASDRMKDTDATASSQIRGAFLFAKELQQIVNNPSAIKITRVKAVYYNYEKYMQSKDEALPAIELPIYYYFNTYSRKWWIVDFINPSSPYWDHVELSSGQEPGDTPPAELFKKLNDKDHLPKGMLLYSTPDGNMKGQVELTEPWEWKDILAWFAAAVGIAALVGSIIFSGGATTPVAIQLMFAVSAIAGGVAAGIDLYEHYKNEDLTPMTAMLDLGNIAASIVGLSALSSGRIIYLASQASIKGTPWVGAWAKLALAADKVYVPLAGLNIGINGFNIAILTADTLKKLDDIDKSAGDDASRSRAKILLLAQLAFAGGMTILSLKGDIASLSKGTNIVIYPGKNGIPVAAAAEGIATLPVEHLNLRGEDEFEAVLAIRQKMFGKAAATEVAKLKDNPAFMSEYAKLNKDVYDILNNPTLGVEAKKQLLGEKIDAFDKLVGGQKLLDKSVFDTARVREMTAALEEGNFGMRMTFRNGKVSMQGVELGQFPELVERVKLTNQSMKAGGSDKELVIILMPSVTGDGLQEILIMSRQRWTIPSGAKPGVSLNAIGKANTAHQQYIIDVGGGTNSFAVDMIPAADRAGATVLNTEYAPTFMEPSMTRDSLTWKNAAAKTDADTVAVIGDPLTNMHEMVGDKTVRQVYINNVNAKYNADQYKALAEQLVQSMDSGGRLTLQWTDELEFDVKLNKSFPRGHIEGEPLQKALDEAAKKFGRTVTTEKDLAPIDYNYGITPSKEVKITPDRPLTEAERKGVTDPVPKFHWDFIFN